MSFHPTLVAFSRGCVDGVGLLREDGIIDLSARESGVSLDSLIRPGAIAAAAERHAKTPADFAASDLTFRPPIPAGGKILCVGVNYPDRVQEYAGEVSPDAPKYPSLFPRFPGSFTGHDQPLVRPTVSEQLDYEGEIVIVLGRGGRHIPEAAALDCISALSLGNEGSVRDWMRHGKFNVTQGKNFDRSGAIGPGLVAYRDESQIADIRLTTRVNGELRQDDRTRRMLFGFRRIIGYISSFTTLAPGDIVFTGTPSGAGARHDPPVWLKPGDVVEVSAEGLGTLRNTIVDEAVA